MTKRKPIPFKTWRNDERGFIFVEWGQGNLRTFDITNWAVAAAFIHELNQGKVSGRY